MTDRSRGARLAAIVANGAGEAMRPSIWPISAAAFFLIAGSAFAASLRDWTDCKQDGDAERSIAGCTRVLADKTKRRRTAPSPRQPRLCLRQEADHERAIADYSEAIKLDPGQAFTYNNRGYAFDRQDDYGRAIADYTEALRIDPDYAFAYKNRGRAYEKTEDYAQAIADYSEALRIDSDDAFAYHGRGQAHYGKGDYDQAIADYNEALRLNPELRLRLLQPGHGQAAARRYHHRRRRHRQGASAEPDIVR